MEHAGGGRQTLTFLFSDIEGSTRRWEQDAEAMGGDLAKHDRVVRAAIESAGGRVFKTVGDAFYAVFSSAPEAVAAAVAVQHGLARAPWRGPAPIRARVALHAGDAEVRDEDFFGPALNRVARVLAAGHGGQVLLTLAAAELVRDALPDDATLRDLGMHRLKDLQRPEAVFQLRAPGLADDFPPLRTLDALPNNLPVQLTSFIGRDAEIASVLRLLESARIVTVSGVGGAGKSRLALQAAADLLDDYADGVWLAELAPISDPAVLPRAVATALRVSEVPGQPLMETLEEFVRPRSLLLLLDNCEHLLDASAGLAEHLLRASEGLRVLATSREPLGVAGEVTYRIPSLSLPPRDARPDPATVAAAEAVRLFVDRARAARPGFELTDANAEAVSQIVLRLDGIALAIELAAARVKVMTVEQIARRLDDRFRLLTGGSRTALPRQQTLRALIDWSHELLSEPERILLRRLSVFAGGWSLEAAEAVAGGDPLTPDAILDLLAHLVDKSLVVVEEGSTESRYRLLETVRQYALDRLMEAGEGPQVRDSHASWFSALAARCDLDLHAPGQLDALAQLDREAPNLTSALQWLLESSPDAALRIAVDLAWYWYLRSRWQEGVAALEAALARTPPLPTRLRGEAILHAASLSGRRGDVERANRLIEEGGAIGDALADDGLIGFARWSQGMRAWYGGRYDDMHRLAQESRDAYRRAGDRWGEGIALFALGNAAGTRGDVRSALAIHDEAMRLFEAIGDRWALAHVLGARAGSLMYLGDPAGAWASGSRGLEYFREIGDLGSRADLLQGATWSRLYAGELDAARALASEAVAVRRELSSEGDLAGAWYMLGVVEYHARRLDVAEELLTRAVEVFRRTGNLRPLADVLGTLGEVALANGDVERARRLHEETLAIREEREDQRGVGFSNVGLAEVALAQGDVERARRHLDVAQRIWVELGLTLPVPDRARMERLQQAAAATAPTA